MLKDYKSLELDKILQQLANETTCADAAALAAEIEPDTDLKHVERLLQETDDAFALMAKFGAPSFYGMTNVTNALRRAQAGGVLNLPELLAVAGTLRAIRSVSDWRKKSESVKTALDYRFETLQPNKFLEERISMTVVNEEEVVNAEAGGEQSVAGVYADALNAVYGAEGEHYARICYRAVVPGQGSVLRRDVYPKLAAVKLPAGYFNPVRQGALQVWLVRVRAKGHNCGFYCSQRGVNGDFFRLNGRAVGEIVG